MHFLAVKVYPQFCHCLQRCRCSKKSLMSVFTQQPLVLPGVTAFQLPNNIHGRFLIFYRNVVAKKSHSSVFSLGDHLSCLESQLLESFALHVGKRRRHETGVVCNRTFKMVNVHMFNKKSAFTRSFPKITRNIKGFVF